MDALNDIIGHSLQESDYHIQMETISFNSDNPETEIL